MPLTVSQDCWDLWAPTLGGVLNPAQRVLATSLPVLEGLLTRFEGTNPKAGNPTLQGPYLGLHVTFHTVRDKDVILDILAVLLDNRKGLFPRSTTDWVVTRDPLPFRGNRKRKRNPKGTSYCSEYDGFYWSTFSNFEFHHYHSLSLGLSEGLGDSRIEDTLSTRHVRNYWVVSHIVNLKPVAQRQLHQAVAPIEESSDLGLLDDDSAAKKTVEGRATSTDSSMRPFAKQKKSLALLAQYMGDRNQHGKATLNGITVQHQKLTSQHEKLVSQHHDLLLNTHNELHSKYKDLEAVSQAKLEELGTEKETLKAQLELAKEELERAKAATHSAQSEVARLNSLDLRNMALQWELDHLKGTLRGLCRQ